jgi:hypothetical protein
LSKCQPSSSPSPKIAISSASSGSALRYSTRLRQHCGDERGQVIGFV